MGWGGWVVKYVKCVVFIVLFVIIYIRFWSVVWRVILDPGCLCRALASAPPPPRLTLFSFFQQATLAFRMPRLSQAATNAASAESQQEVVMAAEGIDNYELPKALVTRIAKSAVSL